MSWENEIKDMPVGTRLWLTAYVRVNKQRSRPYASVAPTTAVVTLDNNNRKQLVGDEGYTYGFRDKLELFDTYESAKEYYNSCVEQHYQDLLVTAENVKKYLV